MKIILTAFLLAGCMSAEDRFNARVASEIERKNGPDADRRCTQEYQIETGWQFYADDAPDCPELRPPGG